MSYLNMETTDEADPTNSLSEDADTAYYCSPCKSDTEIHTALKYCINCKEHLCESCCNFHRKLTLTRNHVLVDKEDTHIASHFDKEKFLCPNHKNAKYEYHCPTHFTFGCFNCFESHGKTCNDMKRIADIAEAYFSSDDVVNFTSDLDSMDKSLSELSQNMDRDKQTVKRDVVDTKDAVVKFKAEVIEKIDALEQQLNGKIDQIQHIQLSKLNTLISSARKIKREFSYICAELDDLQKTEDVTSYYIATEEARQNLLILKDKLQKIVDTCNLGKLIFEPNKGFGDGLMNSWNIGQIVCHEEITKVSLKEELSIRLDGDSGCCIPNITLLPKQKLFLTDSGNSKVKLYDIKEQKIVFSINFPAKPFSAAKVTDTSVVVSFPDTKTLKFIRTDPVLSEMNELPVNGSCFGVAYDNNKLFVSFSSLNKIEIMDLKGQTLQIVEKDEKGQNLFNRPQHVVVDSFQNTVYISNTGENSLVSIDLDGNIKATYKDTDFSNPRQVAVSQAGTIFACTDTNTVHQITRACKKVKILLTKPDGLSYTRAICYDEYHNLLYMGCYGNNIKVFRLSFAPL